MMRLFIGWCILFSFIGFCSMGIDKRKARQKIADPGREPFFLSLPFSFGSPGSIAGMYLFHHKTRHPSSVARSASTVFSWSLVRSACSAAWGFQPDRRIRGAYEKNTEYPFSLSGSAAYGLQCQDTGEAGPFRTGADQKAG